MNLLFRTALQHNIVQCCASLDYAALFRSHSSMLNFQRCRALSWRGGSEYSGGWPGVTILSGDRPRSNEEPLSEQYVPVPGGQSLALGPFLHAVGRLTDILVDGFAVPLAAWPRTVPIPEWCSIEQLVGADMTMSSHWIVPDRLVSAAMRQARTAARVQARAQAQQDEGVDF